MIFIKKTIRALVTSLGLLSLLVAGAPGVSLAAAGDETTTGSIILTPTIENIGVVVNFTGGNNQNKSAALKYKEHSSGIWKTAPLMFADRFTPQYRGSIFGLTANTDYDVQVNFTDADGITGASTVPGTVKTRNDNPPSNGNSYYVAPAPTGNDSNDGSFASPFQTIHQAAATVVAGDTVYVRAGTYAADIGVNTSGSSENYITFRNYDNEIPVIEGGGNPC